jgi:NAD(P)H-hydrate epimerase
MHAPKVGIVVAPGRFHAGVVDVADIGIEQRETEHRRVTSEILRQVPRKQEPVTKYSAGSVLVVGGSPGMTGAACLAAEAAFRADAGYVAVAVPEASLPVIEARLLEPVKATLDRVDELAERASAVALGPGLGRGEKERALVRRLLAELELPAVVDADALFELEPGDWPAARVLTPHAGELGRLLDIDSKEVERDRLKHVRAAAARSKAFVVLKGDDTLVVSPGGRVAISRGDAPALATAGTGDVLSGVIGAMLAKGLPPAHAACAGVYAHVRAGQIAAAPHGADGVIASDVIHALPGALSA